jgi:putative ABC transport system permease protein
MNDIVLTMNLWLREKGIAAQAGNWEAAAGPFATTADVIRTVFNVAIIIIGVVAIIIMMNTLVISVIERTPEIGTMRALGAKKNFVWRMFLYETLAITLVFGFIGIILALIIVGILNAIGIPANNTFLQILFAGDELHPKIAPMSVLTSMVVVTVIGFISHLYPVTVALKIQPIRAIQAK